MAFDWADESSPLSGAQTSETGGSNANWLGQFGSFVNNAGQATGNILSALRGTTNPNSVTGLNAQTNWTPFLLIGGALVAVVLVVALVRK